MNKVRGTPMLENIGIATMMRHEFKLSDFLDEMNRLEIGVVELRCEKPVLYPRDVNSRMRINLRQILEKHSITALVHAPFHDVNLASLNPLMRRASVKQLRECIEFANDVGSKLVVVHPGQLSKDYPKAMLKQSCLNLVDSINGVIPSVEKLDMILALENQHDGSAYGVISFPEDYIEIIEELDSPYVKGAFDVGHANTFKIDLEAGLMKISDYLVNIHIHDNDGKSDLHLPVGEGIIDFRGVLRALKNLNYKGPLIIENKTFGDAIKSRDRLRLIWDSL